MLSEHVRGPTPAQGAKGIVLPAEPDLNRAVEALKAAMIQEALKSAGNVTRAAERLGIPRQSLQKMMKRLGLREVADEE
jgi:transcriptional regulator with PAS, ATPase and Fis domain